MMLHLEAASGSPAGCAGVPASIAEVVTAGDSNPDGSARYYVYVLGMPEIPDGAPLNGDYGVAGFQLGIEYDQGAVAGEQLKVWTWTRCGVLDFPDDTWPESGTGNTITYDLGDCPTDPLVPAGYFYLTAYSPGVMSIAPFPATGLVKLADCEGAEIVLDQTVELSQVGWVSMGGAAKGTDSNGCNPALEPCTQLVPVHETTWGRLKQRYE